MPQRKRRRKRRDLTPLTEAQILAWAEAHHARTGAWPNVDSGELFEDPHEKWRCLDMDLRRGFRGLEGGTSLAQLLADKHCVRNIKNLPDLSVAQILAWADEYHRIAGRWPLRSDGAISGVPREKWSGINAALVRGRRGLPKKSLAQLLAEHRGVRNHRDLPNLTIKAILAWADAFHARTGQWPQDKSGAVDGAPRETWESIDGALLHGRRGLPGMSSLPRLLQEYRGVRNRGNLPGYTEEQILTWADAFYERTGTWPKIGSGSITEAPGETWMRVAVALNEGLRGLRGGDSLPKLLARSRGAPYRPLVCNKRTKIMQRKSQIK